MKRNLIIIRKLKWEAPMIMILLFVLFISCRKFIEVDAPITTTNSDIAFGSDETAASVLTGIYAKMSRTSVSDINGLTSLSFYLGLSSDEFTLFGGNNNRDYSNYYRNSLAANTTGGNFWSNIYPLIYTCNSAIEGLTKSTTLNSAVKNQLLGEAKFIRGFCYYYLTSLYGDVPLALSTDYAVNSTLRRIEKKEVFKQIIVDLLDAESLLTSEYVSGNARNSTQERVRPNKWAATALLARIYLSIGNWAKAEEKTTQVINNTNLYELEIIDKTFLANNREAIWQLQPVNNGRNTEDAWFFILPATGPNPGHPVFLSENLLNSFENGDLRRSNWVGQVVNNGVTYHFPSKYRSAIYGEPVTEYSTVLRLGEQYLIRAEARAQQGKILDGATDLNIIRARSGLSNSDADNEIELLDAVNHERQVELFSEWGARWLDLNRTNKLDSVMRIVAPSKGGIWNSNWALFPIPSSEMLGNKNLNQNAGY